MNSSEAIPRRRTGRVAKWLGVLAVAAIAGAILLVSPPRALALGELVDVAAVTDIAQPVSSTERDRTCACEPTQELLEFLTNTISIRQSDNRFVFSYLTEVGTFTTGGGLEPKEVTGEFLVLTEEKDAQGAFVEIHIRLSQVQAVRVFFSRE